MNKRIHCYAAGFSNSLAREYIKKYSNNTAVVLDPFSGSGTTLIEALSNGNKAIGIDVDPIACLISKVQTRKYPLNWLDKISSTSNYAFKHLENEISSISLSEEIMSGTIINFNGFIANIPYQPKIDYWFSQNQKLVISALIAYRNSIEDERERDIMSVAISSAIIRKWPNTLSLAMDIDHTRPHRVNPEIVSISDQFKLFTRVYKSVINILTELSIESKSWKEEGIVLEGKAEDHLFSIDKGSIDLILSSPPYLNAIDYPRSHKFSEWWLYPDSNKCIKENYLGLRSTDNPYDPARILQEITPATFSTMNWESNHFRKPISRKISQFLVDMDKIISGSEHALKNGGNLILVVANNRINGKVIPIVDLILEIISSHQFTSIKSNSRTLEKNRRRYPFGFKGLMKEEYIISAERK